MTRERDYYGLSLEHAESRTELAGDYMLIWTWRSDPSLGIGGVLWVNWFMSNAYRWQKGSEQGVSLARHDTVSFPPFDEYELTPEQWRDAEFIASGFIKWDGCAQWDCKVHLDSKSARQEFFDTVHLAHQRAAEIMVKDFDKRTDEA
jgi:hypothetical protein